MISTKSFDANYFKVVHTIFMVISLIRGMFEEKRKEDESL